MPDYRTLWRWHFYAGLFCIPFVAVLALTGSVYLFKPQLEAFADRDVRTLSLSGQATSASAQVAAALQAVPGARVTAYELPWTPDAAARVHVMRAQGDKAIVYVHPESLTVLKVIDPGTRVAQFVKDIHGELLIGKTGAILVELAACWAIVMVITGLCLWWPRGTTGLAGVLYPRLNRGSRVLWRDVHAVTGLWVSGLALCLLLTGLPWTTVWGGAFKAVRSLGSPVAIKQDWTTGHEGEHAAHQHAMGTAVADGAEATAAAPIGYDAVVAQLLPLHLAPPVLVQPPREAGASWVVKAESQNRPERVELRFDAATGNQTYLERFEDRPVVDRVVGIGVAAHEGQLFGLFNQLLGVVTALGLLTLCASAVVMWWRRRPDGVLGAPPVPAVPAPLARALVVLICVLGVLLPLLGAALLAVALLEHLVLRSLRGLRSWLGLRAV